LSGLYDVTAVPSAPPVHDLAEWGEAFAADPYPFYARLREQGPVHRARLITGQVVWLIVGHEEACGVLSDSKMSVSWANASKDFAGPAAPVGPHRSVTGSPSGSHMLNSDPPLHTRLRRIVTGAFAPASVLYRVWPTREKLERYEELGVDEVALYLPAEEEKAVLKALDGYSRHL